MLCLTISLLGLVANQQIVDISWLYLTPHCAIMFAVPAVIGDKVYHSAIAFFRPYQHCRRLALRRICPAKLAKKSADWIDS